MKGGFVGGCPAGRGAAATDLFFWGAPHGEVGQLFAVEEYPDIQFVVLDHPAFLPRDPRKKTDIWEHVKKLRIFPTEHGELPTR